jgi:hypothetical protein
LSSEENGIGLLDGAFEDGLAQTVEAQKQEIAGLRQQLEGWQNHWQSVENSAGWRLLSTWRLIRDRLTPEGTRRRRIYDSMIGRLRPVPR